MSMRPGAWSCVHREADEARDCMSGCASGAGSHCMPPHVCATAQPCDKREKRHSSMYHVRKRSFLLPAASIRRPPTHMLKGQCRQRPIPSAVAGTGGEPEPERRCMDGWMAGMHGWLEWFPKLDSPLPLTPSHSGGTSC